MGMNVGSDRGKVKSDINVTPLVDVMLVLLIIIMLIAPLLQKGVDVKLPMAANTVDKPDTQDQTVVAIDASKNLFLNSIPVGSDAELASKLTDILADKHDQLVVIKADEDVQVQCRHGRHGCTAPGGR